MKKIIYTLLLTAAITACVTTVSQWNREQRRTIQRAISEYRDMVYVSELSDAEYYIFANDATDIVEMNYPSFDEFVALPAMNDSVEVIVTTLIIEQLDADGANIRHIYPYRELRQEGILPRGVSRKDQRSFYKCLARKVNTAYDSYSEFLHAVIANETDAGQITQFQQECAKSVLGWEGLNDDAKSAKMERKR
ncbi:MAG: hypothetical protein R3Y68_05460 [Rikenellaceae bacterium]